MLTLREIFLYSDRSPLIFSQYLFLFLFTVGFAIFSLIHKNKSWRNLYLLLFSLFFYYKSGGLYFWLLLLSTVVDYYCGNAIHKTSKQHLRKTYLVISLVANLGLLAFFKYSNYFVDLVNGWFGTEFAAVNFMAMIGNVFGGSFDIHEIILPVGISFYTFQTLSYTIDIYRREIEPARNIIDFGFFVTFFPQLVAGPIVRAADFLPQMYKKYSLTREQFGAAVFLIMCGLFKKVVVSDYLSVNFVDRVFEDPQLYSGFSNLMAVYGYSIQIYCDFSGYSDIAIGASRIMGYDLMENFRQPYLAKSISEFWHRWHISLSSWFRDYLYIPLGGNRVGKMRWYLNLMIVFVVSGLWHGANWTFVVWGFLHGAFLVFAVLVAGLRERWFHFSGLNRMPKLLNFLKIVVTFHLVCLGWIFFRANSLGDALFIVQQIAQLNFSPESIEALVVKDLGLAEMLVAIASIGFLLIAHFVLNSQKLSGHIVTFPRSARWAFYYALILGIAFFGVFSQSEFIYFQF